MTINYSKMSDTFWESAVMYAMVLYTFSMNFLTSSPPPPNMDSYIQPLLHVSQLIAAVLASILAVHTCYEKFGSKFIKWVKSKFKK